MDAETRDKSQNQGVYIYQGERPSKRRKVAPTDHPHSDSHCFVPLLNGEEPPDCVQLRYDTYKKLWSEQERSIQEILDEVDAGVLTDVLSFVQTTSPETYNGCIPTALVTVGSNVSSLTRLLSRLNEQLTSSGNGGVVVLESGDAPNLKTTLKNIIRAAVTNTEGNDGYQKFLTDRDGPRLLGYDLDLLYDHVQRNGTKKLVLALRDSEAFDPSLLTDLLSLFSSWLDRIPFTLVFGISTSVEIFQSRLPRSCVALLQGKHFEVQEAGNCADKIYEMLQLREGSRLRLGRNISATLFEKSSDYFQSPEAFSHMLKYAYMSHFFANPLSVLLAAPAPTISSPGPLCQAIRNLPSFRVLCEDLAENGSAQQVRRLLEDDDHLLQQATQHINHGQETMKGIFQAVSILHTCLQCTQTMKKNSRSDLSIRALSGELSESQTIEDMLATLKISDSEKLRTLIERLADDNPVPGISEDFQNLVQSNAEAGPLQSAYNVNSSVVKTTVEQQRVHLSKGQAQLSAQDLEYTQLINELIDGLRGYFTANLNNPQDLPLHEVFLFDLRNPLKETFAPRPRFAIERALTSPFDYLISSSDVSETRISAKQPATAILYQLYLESGALINVHDLWQAFRAVFESEQGDRCDDRVVMALFYSAMSELKTFGMVKNTRKKADHLAKSAWMGL
ncbi:uncharacterized protein PFLUO_LOCUS2890 [Penicillium psychrofluorescens]|uniref:uncharacterized protein n=1 Tax=Penicillium psychrofluorescens TaxID=3158075 RepID=UPI003CCCFC75